MSLPSQIPDLYHGRPEWPSKDDQHLFWIGLRSKFEFAHHPAHPDECPPRDDECYCSPAHLIEKLTGILCQSQRGSILVTGYRGTGKTSLVAACAKNFKTQKKAKPVLWIKVNLATVSSGQEVLWLTYNALEKQVEKNRAKLGNENDVNRLLDTLRNTSPDLRASRYSVTSAARRGMPGPHETNLAPSGPKGEVQHTFEGSTGDPRTCAR